MSCNAKRRKDTRICIGDLDRRIVLQLRKIKPPEADGIDYNETNIVEQSWWASIETVSGTTVFDGNNIEQVVTHNFYIRYLPGLTFESWVLFEGKRYRIIDVVDYNERHEFYVLRCSLRGAETTTVTGN